MVAIFGTMVADVLHIVLGVPYVVATVFFALTLTTIFGAWYVTEKTLSIHTINTRRRELSPRAIVQNKGEKAPSFSRGKNRPTVR